MFEARKSVVILASLLAPLLLLLAIPRSAAASTYGVRQCSVQQGSVSDAAIEGVSTGYTANNSCGQAPDNYLQVGTSGPVGAGQAKAWTFTAPNGTRIDRATGTYLMQGRADHGGHRPFFLYRGVNQGSDQTLGHQGAGNTGGGFDTDVWPNVGAISRVGIGVGCQSGSTCPNKSGIYSRIGDLAFSMRDLVAPAVPALSGPALGGWINGTEQLNFSVSDTGAGVYVSNTAVNGTFVDLDALCTPMLDGSGSATRMQPCPANGSGSSPFDVAGSSVVQGDNTVTVCVYEYGEDDLQNRCKSATVKVDTIVPLAPSGLTVAGGEDWRRDNEFTLRFGGQSQGANGAPVVGASVRITGAGEYDHTEYYPGANLDTIDDVSVPAKGEYTAQVYFRDAAGNESLSSSSSVHLRFDDTVPAPQAPQKANGWISGQELADGYLQGWDPVQSNLVPPSGIAGYRVVVNANSDSDPCSGAGDPRACGGPITEPGQGNLQRLLRSGDLREGVNYVHVVPISGSGMRATDVKHARLKADFTEPETQLAGDGAGRWLNHDANLTLTASDALSGMVDTAEFPFDQPPIVKLTVDGRTTADTPNVSTTVGGEGIHQLSWCARDLAGNGAGDCGSGGAPAGRGSSGAATVRIDKTAPSAAFTDRQDPGDPDQLIAPVSDVLSGVASGRISYHPVGGNDWKHLDTDLEDDQLVARVDSSDLKRGITYEFRVQASDKAGNTATSTTKQNGQPMRVTGPFRTITSVADLRINGRSKARIKYGRKPRVRGELLSADGRPVANATVELRSSYFAGAKKRDASNVVTTDARGGFTARLPKGPGRTLIAYYRGDRRYLGVRSAPARVAVKSKVTLKVPNVVDSDGGLTFKGRLRAKGAKLGKRGKRLEIQVRVGGKWKTVGKSIRTNGRGRFKLRYEFTADYPHAVRYTFRAAVLKERGFPYLPSKSKRRKVTVTP